MTSQKIAVVACYIQICHLLPSPSHPYFVAPVPIYKFLLRPSWIYRQFFTLLLPVLIYKFILRRSCTYLQIFTSSFLDLYTNFYFIPIPIYTNLYFIPSCSNVHFFTSSLLYLYTNVYIIPPCSAAKYKFLLHCSYTYIQICTSFLHVAMYNFLLRSQYI
jgi:hypothetical protein